MFDAGIFWGLIGIAMAIVSVGFPSYWTYRNRSNSLTNTTNFLRKIILGLIDERIAMLGGYIAEVPEWKEKGHEYVDAITDKIT